MGSTYQLGDGVPPSRFGPPGCSQIEAPPPSPSFFPPCAPDLAPALPLIALIRAQLHDP